jgi:CBS domain-containing protein
MRLLSEFEAFNKVVSPFCFYYAKSPARATLTPSTQVVVIPAIVTESVGVVATAETMTVQDIAREAVVTAHRDQTAGNLATLMKEETVGSVIIEDEDQPVGIVTDRDLAMNVLETRADPTQTTADEIMTEDPATAHTDDGVFEVIERMSTEQVRRMPIVDDEESLTGVVTMDDFLVLLSDEMNHLKTVVEAESPPY